MKLMNFRLNRHLEKMIEDGSKRLGISKSEFIRQAILFYYASIEKIMKGDNK